MVLLLKSATIQIETTVKTESTEAKSRSEIIERDLKKVLQSQREAEEINQTMAREVKSISERLGAIEEEQASRSQRMEKKFEVLETSLRDCELVSPAACHWDEFHAT